MTINEREGQIEPPDELSARNDDPFDLNLWLILAEEAPAINRRFLIFIDRKNEEWQSLAGRFDENLDARLSLITPTDCKSEEDDIGPYPADWPAF